MTKKNEQWGFGVVLEGSCRGSLKGLGGILEVSWRDLGGVLEGSWRGLGGVLEGILDGILEEILVAVFRAYGGTIGYL